MIRCFSHEEVQSSGLGLCFMMGVELNFSPSDRSFLRSFWPRMSDNWVVAGVPSVSVLDGWWIEGCIEALGEWVTVKFRGYGAGPHARHPVSFN